MLQGFKSPVYNLILEEDTSEGKYIVFTCTIGRLKVVGDGLSKKVAKQQAAEKMVIKLLSLVDGFDEFEKKIGYVWSNKSNLLKAFTDISHKTNPLDEGYGRMEFVGDRVLNLLIAEHIYQQNLEHQQQVYERLVSNNTFACVAARHNFDKYLKSESQVLQQTVQSFVSKQEENNWKVCARDVVAPKVLANVFEAVAYSIYQDSGYSLQTVWKVYYPLMKDDIEQCFDQHKKQLEYSGNIYKRMLNCPETVQKEQATVDIPETQSSDQSDICIADLFDSRHNIENTKQSSEVHQSPEQYIDHIMKVSRVVTDTSDCEAIVEDLMLAGQPIGLDAEGINLGKTGTITLLQVSTQSGEVFIFDIKTNPALMTQGKLGELLQSEDVTKVIHDCRNDSACLYFEHGITMNNVFDTNAAYAVLHQQMTGQSLDTTGDISFNKICEKYKAPSNPIKKDIKKYYVRDEKFWGRRPLSRDMICYAAADVISLVPTLYTSMNRDIVGSYQILLSSLIEERILWNIRTEEMQQRKKERKLEFEKRKPHDEVEMNEDNCLITYGAASNKRMAKCAAARNMIVKMGFEVPSDKNLVGSLQELVVQEGYENPIYTLKNDESDEGEFVYCCAVFVNSWTLE